MNMTAWLREAAAAHKALPILSFPGVQLIGTTVDQLVGDGELQARCMVAVAQRFDTLASVSFMDLSVEAEAFGSPIRFSGDEVPTVTAPIVHDMAEAEALRVPAVGEGRTNTYLQAIAQAAREITDRPVLAGAIGPFSLAGRLNDMTEIMVNCYEEPELVHTLLRKATDFLKQYFLAFKQAGAQGIVMAEPAAGLLSPDLVAEFSVPYVREIREAVDGDDFLFVYHNCGKTLRMMPELLKIGTRMFHLGNAIALEEALACIPSDVLVMGNVDPAGVLRQGTPESVREATQAVLAACAKYPNFILSSGCDIPPATPLANLDAFFAANAAYTR